MAKVRKKRRQARNAPEVVEAPRLSIGERLRQAREAKGLDVAVVAERLHLKRATVMDLEAENFDRLPARVFVRGYYRNYARLLELPEEALLAEFDNRCPEGEECSGAPPVVAQGVRREIRSNHGLVRLVTWLVVISVLAALGLWWKDRSERAVPPPSEAAAPAQQAPVAQTGGESVSEAPPAQEPVAAAAAPTEAAAPEEAKAGADAALPEAAAPGGAEERSAAAAPSDVAPPAVEAPAPARVELRFLEDSWVDVRGAGGSFKVVGLRKAGEHLLLEGDPPWNLILGNARGVRVLVNGEPRDFSSRTRRNVARFTLEP